jgi:hypothetical protein
VLEERNQDDQREAIQERCQKRGEQPEREQPAVGADQPKEPELGTQGLALAMGEQSYRQQNFLG